MDDNRPVVIFILGGPGSGKGTQCKLVQEYFKFIHISAGDCLRNYLTMCKNNEVDARHQEIVEDCINNGKIVPVQITVELIKLKMENEIEKLKNKEGLLSTNTTNEHHKYKNTELHDDNNFLLNMNMNNNTNDISMEEYYEQFKYDKIEEHKKIHEILKKNKLKKSQKYKFIIDGFPRNQDNLDGWIKYIGSYAQVHLCLFLNCSDDNMIKRCIDRGLVSGRVDDNINTLRKRFETHKNDSMPVIKLFLNADRCIFVDANKNIDQVWKDMQYIFSSFEQF